MPELIDVKDLSMKNLFKSTKSSFSISFIKKYGHRLQAIKDDTGVEFEDLVQWHGCTNESKRTIQAGAWF
ncbi:hypothetical protein ACUC2M_15775 [Bacillus cytotoxicus]